MGSIGILNPCISKLENLEIRSNVKEMQRLLIGSISPNRLTGTVAARTRQSTDKVATEKNKEAKQRRVVVTGMGVVTSLGHDPDTFYKNLLEGVSGISEIESF